MIGRLFDLLRYLIPPTGKATEMHVLAWRWMVAVVATIALVMGIVATGVTPLWSGYAYAEDIEELIEAAVTPVIAQLNNIDRKQTENTSYIKRLVKSDIAAEIHAEKLVWCRATGPSERQRIRHDLDELQEEYELVAGNGRKATEPDCA